MPTIEFQGHLQLRFSKRTDGWRSETHREITGPTQCFLRRNTTKGYIEPEEPKEKLKAHGT